MFLPRILDKILVKKMIGGIPMNGIKRLPDHTLIEAYLEAIKLELAEEFILLLFVELKRREIPIPNQPQK